MTGWGALSPQQPVVHYGPDHLSPSPTVPVRPARGGNAERGRALHWIGPRLERVQGSPALPTDSKQEKIAKSAAAQEIVRRTASAAQRTSEAERGSAKSAAAREIIRRPASAPKRVGQDADAHVEDAKRAGGSAALAPGHRRETQHACGASNGMGGSGGRAASPPKRYGRAAGDGRDEGKCGVLNRATCAAESNPEAGERSASRPSMRDRHRFTSSAANPLAHRAGYGAAGLAERSSALGWITPAPHPSKARLAGAGSGVRKQFAPLPSASTRSPV